MFFVVGARAARHQQQVIALIGFVDMPIGVHEDAIGRTQRPTLGAQSGQVIVGLRFQVTVGDRKNFQRPSHVEQQKLRKQHHCHGLHGGITKIYVES